MKLDHGRKWPLLLSPVQNLQVSAGLFVGSALLLAALVNGASNNREVLDSIAKSAAVEQTRAADELTRTAVVAPSREQPSAEAPVRVSVPAGWQWRGCRKLDDDSVEVLLSLPVR